MTKPHAGAINSPRYHGVLAGRGLGTSRPVCWGNGRLQVGRPGLSLYRMPCRDSETAA
jgi:hypothetical protein